MIAYLKTIKNKEKILIFLIAGMYFIFLLKFYLIDYHVPDLSLYFFFASQGAKAKDGFSSLFILLASFAAVCPKGLNLLCLVLMSLSLINISFFILEFLKADKFLCWLAIALLYSTGCFYYVYGKLFYDFPFTAFTFSLCLLILRKIYTEDRKKESNQNNWLLLCAMLGFCLSWKPYNIFCVAGTGLLLLTKKESQILIIQTLKSFKKIVASLSCFIGGYLAGNFNFLFYPRETLTGIMAYPASFSIKPFFMGKGRLVWDHINDLPFNVSTLTIITVFLLMFLLPLIYKKWGFLVISLFMWVCFTVFITFFSAGNTWHGFTMALFVNIYTIFLFSSILKIKARRVGNLLIITSILIQCIVCFAYYLPLQNHWHDQTGKAIQMLEEKESEIYSDVCSLISQIEDENYAVDLALKRYKPVGISPALWNSFRRENIYCAATNYAFLDPLQATNYLEWSPFINSGRYSSGSVDTNYVLWIVPDALKSIGDVVNLHVYDAAYAQTNFIHKDGYSIYLLKRIDQ